MIARLKLLIFTAIVAALLPSSGRAQTNAVIQDTDTNAPTLADMMSSNNIVTNTVGIVLVKISPTLWAGKYDVTQEAYLKTMHSNPSVFGGPDHPVDSVSWDDAMAFCRQLTGQERKDKQLPAGFAYNLPTESQWEMLARSASPKDAIMAINGNARGSTAPVGKSGPGSYGLYDLRGNVWAWCLDSHDPSYHVLRGGAWDTFDEPSSRFEFRWYAHPEDAPRSDFGFRVLLESGN